jgi:hypothetical protein
MQFNSSAIVLDFTAYTRNFRDSPKESGQVTSVAKKSDSATQSNGFENVDWEGYQKVGLRHLTIATVLT